MGLCLGIDSCASPLAKILLLDLTPRKVVKASDSADADQHLEVTTCGRRQDYLQHLGIQRSTAQVRARCLPNHSASAPQPAASFDGQCKPHSGHAISLKPKCSQDVEGSFEIQSTCCAEKGGELPRLSLGQHNDFRVSFLRKLSYHKVWLPKAERPPMHQTVIIFDWDDTLLCTSFLQGESIP